MSDRKGPISKETADIFARSLNMGFGKQQDEEKKKREEEARKQALMRIHSGK